MTELSAKKPTYDEIEDLAIDNNKLMQFFLAVGFAINRWAFVDRALFNLFYIALDTDKKKAALLFYSSPHISDHIRHCNKLIAETSAEKYRRQWKKIFDRLNKLIETRNILAHSPSKVQFAPAEYDESVYDFSSEDLSTILKWSLVHEPLKALAGRRSHPPLTGEEVGLHILEVVKVETELHKLITKMALERAEQSKRSISELEEFAETIGEG